MVVKRVKLLIITKLDLQNSEKQFNTVNLLIF